MKFDLMRVREQGWVIPRHNVGMIKCVRGVLNVTDERIVKLNRSARVAKFRTDDGEVLQLVDAMLMHASQERLVLSGFERELIGMKEVDFAQTWILSECEGEKPQSSRGPAFAM